jgi:DNA-binding transcriptional LysR family regulator
MNGLIDHSIADLALLVRVVDFAGFTAASRATGIPQATVSRRISMLEKRLGMRLLDRTTRQLKLTLAGTRVYESARLMLDQAEAAGAAANELKAEPSGALRILAPVILGRYYIGDIVAEFLSMHPAVHVKLELASRSVDLVEEGFDIAIRIGNVPDSSLALTHLGKAQTGLYVSPTFHAAHIIRHPSDLGLHPIMAPLLNLKKSTLAFTRDTVRTRVDVSLHFVCNDAQPLLSAAEKGLGVAVLPRFKGDAAVRSGTLVRVLDNWELPDTIINALTPSTRGALPAVRLFLEYAKQRLAQTL